MEHIHYDSALTGGKGSGVGPAAISILITNLLIVASVILIILNQVLQGHSFSHVYFSLSTLVFIALIGFSIFLLTKVLFSLSSNPPGQNQEEQWQKHKAATQTTRTSVRITAFSVVFYALVVSIVFFF